MSNILIVAAHADDEALGCGGTIARHVAQGDIVHLALMTNGVTARANATEADIANRTQALQAAQAILGISSVENYDFPDNQMDCAPLLAVAQKIETILARVMPKIVYTHHQGDLNVDHRQTHLAVMTACRPLPNSPVEEIYGFEVLSSTEWATPQQSPFSPNVFVDISETLPIKLKALEAYKEEMRAVPHSRSVRHAEILARHRGYCVGLEAAEAFEAYRVIQKGRDNRHKN